jgi:hypothetical protein
MGKIELEIIINIPDDFDMENKKRELWQLEQDIKEKFEEITGYKISNIYAKIRVNDYD